MMTKFEDSEIKEIEKIVAEKMATIPVAEKNVTVKIGDSKPVKIKGDTAPEFKTVLAYVCNGNAVMMTGNAGTGKGTIARQIAEAMKAGFYEVNAVKNSYDLTGFVDANSYYIETPFYNACKDASEDKKTVFLFDEMDCSEPEVLKVFNEAISSFEFTFPNNETLKFPNLTILCACNTYGTGANSQYCGEQLDASTLDRFAMVEVGYDRNIELKLSNNDVELVDFIEQLRNQCNESGLQFVISYRSIKRISSMKGVLPLKEVMQQCLFKSMGKDDKMMILSNMSKNMSKFESNLYFKASEGQDVEIASKEKAKKSA